MAKVVGGECCSDSRWLLGYFKHEEEAQDKRLALQRSLDDARLGGRGSGSSCEEKKGLAGVETQMEMQAGWQDQQVVLLV